MLCKDVISKAQLGRVDLTVFGVRSGLQMMLGHKALSSLDMSPYRIIGAISDPISRFSHEKCPGPNPGPYPGPGPEPRVAGADGVDRRWVRAGKNQRAKNREETTQNSFRNSNPPRPIDDLSKTLGTNS